MTYITNIDPTEYLAFYKPYIDKAGELELMNALEAGKENTLTFLKQIEREKWEYRYAENKWTIKEILQHLIDSERVFAYRALRFSRNDKTNLPGFDENDYANESNASSRNIDDLLEEYAQLRTSTIALFSSFSENMLLQKGNANNAAMSVRAVGFVIVGHEKHHLGVIKERYL